MAEVRDGKLSGNEFSKLISEMEQDLIALFKVIEDDVADIVSQGVSEGWTVEQTMREIDNLFEGVE